MASGEAEEEEAFARHRGVSALSATQASKVFAVPLAQANAATAIALPVITHSLIQARPKRYTRLPANLRAPARSYTCV